MPATFHYFEKGDHIAGADVTILRLNVLTNSQSTTRYRVQRGCCGEITSLDHSRIARYAREGRGECRLCARLSTAVRVIVAIGQEKGMTDVEIIERLKGKNARRAAEGKPLFKIPSREEPAMDPSVLELKRRHSRDYPSLRIALPLWPAPPSAVRKNKMKKKRACT